MNVRATCTRCGGTPRARVHFDVNEDEGNALEGCGILWTCCGVIKPVAQGEVAHWCERYQAQERTCACGAKGLEVKYIPEADSVLCSTCLDEALRQMHGDHR